MSANIWAKLDDTERTVGVHRRQTTRWEDLDSAYNDGATPSKLTRLQRVMQYGLSAWIATAFFIAAYYGLKALWNLVSGLLF